MAFNLQTFKARTLTSVVFVIIMLCGLLINQWTFFLLFTIIHFGCFFEYKNLAGKIEPAYKNISSLHAYGVMLAGWGFMLCMTGNEYEIASIKLTTAGLYCMIIGLIAIFIGDIINKNFKLKTLFISIAGLLYISFSCGCMINFRFEGGILIDLGLIFPMIIITSMWINDTMAYIVGSLIGKTPLSSISPKKTWEGTIGGLLLAVVTISTLGYFFIKAGVLQLIIISSIACIAGIFGDLFESKLKRMAGVKDSGKIMPGHGGFLDRFDSMLIATIFVWLYVKLFL